MYLNFALAGVQAPMTGRRAMPERDGRAARPARWIAPARLTRSVTSRGVPAA